MMPDPSFGESVFKACNQAFPVTKALAVLPVPDMFAKPMSMPTKPKNPTLWSMPSTSSQCQLSNHCHQQATLTSAMYIIAIT